MTTALFPGSFDPPTNGHLDIATRASRLVEQLIIVVFHNRNKQSNFSIPERVRFWQEATDDLSNVEVESFSGLLTEYATRRGGELIVKGIRSVSDFDYEQQMAQMNLYLTGIETIFLSTLPRWSYLSSSLVMEIANLGGDVSDLVPSSVAEQIVLKEATDPETT